MRRKIVAGNWKMNKTINEAKELTLEIQNLIEKNVNSFNFDELSIIIAPPFINLHDCYNLIKDHKKIITAAQNCYFEDKGAFTGEISAEMIKSVGAEYVIIGHSERRNYFKETNEHLLKKVESCLKYNLKPIFCCGELLPERQAGSHFEVVKKQITETIFALSDENFKKIVIAYEPVWAIGTGVTASPEQAQEMHFFIRELIKTKYSAEISDSTTILYGGSCNAKNAKELFLKNDVDGGLIGGASLIASDFITIINSI